MVLPALTTQNAYVFFNLSLQHHTPSNLPTYTYSISSITYNCTVLVLSSLPSHLYRGSGLFFMSQTLEIAPVALPFLPVQSSVFFYSPNQPAPNSFLLCLLLFPFTPSTFHQTYGYIALFSCLITDFPPLPCHNSQGQKLPTFQGSIQIHTPARVSLSLI